MWREVGEKHGVEVHYIGGGGTLSAEISEALRARQRKYGLETAWLTRKAELHVLQKHTYTSLSYITGYASVRPHPAPQPEDLSNGQLNKTRVREVYNPHWNLPQVQPTPALNHFEWFIHYQCYRWTCLNIPVNIPVKYKVSEQAVEQATKRVSDIIALPLRLRPKGRPKKIPNR